MELGLRILAVEPTSTSLSPTERASSIDFEYKFVAKVDIKINKKVFHFALLLSILEIVIPTVFEY